MNSIKVELSHDGDFIGIRTYDRIHGARGRFLLSRHTIIDVMFDSTHKVLYETDCGHFAEVWRQNEDLAVRLTWLSESSGGEVWGFRQTLVIPSERLKQLFSQIGRIRFLYKPRVKTTEIVVSESAARTIRRILEDKYTRRAFSKAMRNNFNWSDEVVTLYNDGGYSFYFTTRSGCPKNGGLILHDGERNGHPYVHYSIHT